MIESFIFHFVVGIVPFLQLEKRAHVSENKLKFKEKWFQQYTRGGKTRKKGNKWKCKSLCLVKQM